jgi:hypothetical protein
MTSAYELFEAKRMSFFAGRATIDPQQGREVSQRVNFRTVTTILLTSTAAVLGENAAPARKPSLAGILNDFTRWTAA